MLMHEDGLRRLAWLFAAAFLLKVVLELLTNCYKSCVAPEIAAKLALTNTLLRTRDLLCDRTPPRGEFRHALMWPR